MALNIGQRKPRQIVVMGGGGFSMEPRNPRLEHYILSLTKKRSPRICLVPTASGDSPDYIRRFYRAFNKHSCRPMDLPLFDLARKPEDVLLKQDVIYVGGGSTANLLAIWRLHGVDQVMRRAWESGIVLCGVSAGMLCWFDSGVTDSFGPLGPLSGGLGFLVGSACPHFGAGTRRTTFHRFVREGTLPAGVAADDGAAIHYVNETVHQCVASRPNALAYRIYLHNGDVVEKRLPTALLSRDGKVRRA